MEAVNMVIWLVKTGDDDDWTNEKQQHVWFLDENDAEVVVQLSKIRILPVKMAVELQVKHPKLGIDTTKIRSCPAKYWFNPAKNLHEFRWSYLPTAKKELDLSQT